MAKKLGNDYRLWIESSTPGTYNEIKGQRSLRYTRQSASIDISDKNNSPYGLTAPGLFTLAVTCDGILDLPDVNGFERLNTQFKAQTATKFQIRRGGSSGATPADVVLEGTFYALSLDQGYGQNEASDWSLSLGAASAPTVDTLL